MDSSSHSGGSADSPCWEGSRGCLTTAIYGQQQQQQVQMPPVSADVTAVGSTQNVGVSANTFVAAPGSPPLPPSGTVISRESEPDYPPKPDVITGYVGYGKNLSPTYTVVTVGNRGGCFESSPIYATRLQANNALNVSDPRMSATYGNPYLRRVWSSYRRIHSHYN